MTRQRLASVTSLADRRAQHTDTEPEPLVVELHPVAGDRLVAHVHVHGRLVGGICATNFDQETVDSWSWWAEGDGQLSHGYPDRLRACEALVRHLRIVDDVTITDPQDGRP